jgi:site-specific recombinase XerD
LDRFLIERGVGSIEEVSPAVIDAFLASRPRDKSRSFNVLLGIVRHLFDWLVIREVIEESPVRSRKRRVNDVRLPFLFDLEQATALVEAAGAIPDYRNTRLIGPTYRMVFVLLYGLGLRVGEVRRLQVRDIDRERKLLVIRETKFAKSRLVPHGPAIACELYDYLDQRARFGGTPPTAPALSFQRHRRDRPLARGAIGNTFRRLLPSLGLELAPGDTQPRVHDLRHSFAVGTLLRWYREGLDPADRLLHLSTFMGHVQPQSTAIYLTITEELLTAANERFERRCGSAGGAL